MRDWAAGERRSSGRCHETTIPLSGCLPTCCVESKDIFAVLLGVCWTSREMGLRDQADDFLGGAVVRFSFDDMVRLASEYVEMRSVGE